MVKLFNHAIAALALVSGSSVVYGMSADVTNTVAPTTGGLDGLFDYAIDRSKFAVLGIKGGAWDKDGLPLSDLKTTEPVIDAVGFTDDGNVDAIDIVDDGDNDDDDDDDDDDDGDDDEEEEESSAGSVETTAASVALQSYTLVIKTVTTKLGVDVENMDDSAKDDLKVSLKDGFTASTGVDASKVTVMFVPSNDSRRREEGAYDCLFMILDMVYDEMSTGPSAEDLSMAISNNKLRFEIDGFGYRIEEAVGSVTAIEVSPNEEDLDSFFEEVTTNALIKAGVDDQYAEDLYHYSFYNTRQPIYRINQLMMTYTNIKSHD